MQENSYRINLPHWPSGPRHDPYGILFFPIVRDDCNPGADEPGPNTYSAKGLLCPSSSETHEVQEGQLAQLPCLQAWEAWLGLLWTSGVSALLIFTHAHLIYCVLMLSMFIIGITSVHDIWMSNIATRYFFLQLYQHSVTIEVEFYRLKSKYVSVLVSMGTHGTIMKTCTRKHWF